MSLVESAEGALLERLAYFHQEFRALEALEAGDAKIDRLLLELSHFIVEEEAQRAFLSLAQDEELESRCRYIQAAAAAAAQALERAQALAAGWDLASANRYLSEVSELALLDLRDARVTPASLVLFIGSGAFPVTAITLARREGCRVLCCDTHEPAETASRVLLAALGLNARVDVSSEPWEDKDLAGFTHIYIASLVPDKERLLAELHRRINPSATILVRYGNGLKSLFNYSLGQIPGDSWRILHRCDERRHLYDTVLLQPIR